MKSVCIFLLGSTVLALPLLPALAHDGAREIEEGRLAAESCSLKVKPGGKCEPGELCSYQVDLPSLTIQLPREFSLIEKALREVEELKEAVLRVQKSCQDCKLQADDNRETGRNELLDPNLGASEEKGDHSVKDLQSKVSELSSNLKDAKDQINLLQERLDHMNLNRIENYVDNKVANLTNVVNSLGGKCSSNCPSSPEVQGKPIQHLIYRDCSDYYAKGMKRSGIYRITPDPRYSGFEVFCDMASAGGGWTVLQERLDGSTNFNRTWKDYKYGFGNLSREFWLGNDKIHHLTKSKEMVLRIELEDFNRTRKYAIYDTFYVANEYLKYRLNIGNYSGTIGNALQFSKHYNHDQKFFTTPDRDNDRYPSGNCGLYYGSGWWFDACLSANLNGKYYHKSYRGVRNGIFWGTWRGVTDEHPGGLRQAFKQAKMMIRPKDFRP
ncbi:fibroleukin [Ornithorhynchus anatinus]|uniref:Fibrinogen like 2 n=1 Tax=Ornithorhynchus anatinus TaxID=9258 RepID=A0A6I8NWY6_ORNAN|nr:fibroleukin [Ornithorhynchus anatinus]